MKKLNFRKITHPQITELLYKHRANYLCIRLCDLQRQAESVYFHDISEFQHREGTKQAFLQPWKVDLICI